MEKLWEGERRDVYTEYYQTTGEEFDSSDAKSIVDTAEGVIRYVMPTEIVVCIGQHTAWLEKYG